MAENVNEEHFLLVVQEKGLQELLDTILKASEEPDTKIELQFHTGRVGSLIVDHEGEKAAAAVTLHDVPTQIETYKSHNQVHLVKNGDIGQALVVHELHHVQDPAEQEKLEGILAVLMGMEQHNELPATVQSGLTPPMIRPDHVFKRQFNVKPELVTEVESQLLALMHGEAPEGWVIEDTAEVFIKDKDAETGEWVPLSAAPAEYRMPPS